MEKVWLRQYPAGVPAQVSPDRYSSLVALLEESFSRHAALPACVCLGRMLRFGQIEALSAALAAYLQSLGLGRGERVAVMLHNVPQYLVAVAAILRVGAVVVNVNPLCSARELEHQLKDSGACAIVVLENFAATLQQVLRAVPTRHVVLTGVGDLLGPLTGRWVNHAARHLEMRVPAFDLPGAVRFNDALARGRHMTLTPPALGPQDIALLQYTGGTTGASKGAVLLHRHLVANLLQAQAWYGPVLARLPAGEQLTTACALPLDHIFGFTLVMLLGLHQGARSVLIPDAGDLRAALKALARQRVHCFPGVDSLFHALAMEPGCARVDWSGLRLSLGGGMAVRPATARLWVEKTGCPICEGYGLSETSPAVTCNPADIAAFSGSIGVPLPGTEVKLLDEGGGEVGPGAPGEILIRGPQVMAGYWQRPDETARVMTADGFLRSGDIGVMDEHGALRLVDRKKDLILVSGFNVYPSEIEELLAHLPGVRECAAIGVPDARSGEAVKVVVVRSGPGSAWPTEVDVRSFCEVHLAGYKRPRVVEFRQELPRSPAGKVLRRELRGPA